MDTETQGPEEPDTPESVDVHAATDSGSNAANVQRSLAAADAALSALSSALPGGASMHPAAGARRQHGVPHTADAHAQAPAGPASSGVGHGAGGDEQPSSSSARGSCGGGGGGMSGLEVVTELSVCIDAEEGDEILR